MRNSHVRARPAAAASVLGLSLVTIALLAGCSGGPASRSSSSEGTASRPGSATGGANRADASGHPGPSSGQAVARLLPAGRQLVFTAQLSVRARNVDAAVTRATRIVTDAGGYVEAENAANDPGHPSRATATIELKIPVTAYAATLARLDGGILGTRLSLRQQAQDVTRQVADVGSQVASARAAIAQLRALLSHAGSVGDLLDVQNQVNSQESVLESLEAQQNALNHETAFGTVTITVLGPKAAPKAPAPKPPPGLVSGLSGGWHAFRTAVDWLLAVIGAVAPFAVVAAIAGYAAYRLRRRVRPGP